MKCSGTSCTSTSKPTSPSTLKPAALGVERGARAELHGVGRDREVGLADQPRVVAGAQRDRDALERREAGGRREARVEPADRQHEARRRRRSPARSGGRPVIGNWCASRESTSTASIAAVPSSKSMTPIASRLRRTRSLSARRQQRGDAAQREQPRARPNSRISARSIRISVGVSQPILARSPRR